MSSADPVGGGIPDALLTTCSTAPRRWDLLHRIQRLCRPADPFSRGPAVCGCGRPAADAESVNIHLRSGQDGRPRAGVSGVYRCGSPWLCSVCSVGKAAERAERVGKAVTATYERGGHAALIVLTARHSLATSLSDLKTLIADSSRRARQGRAWTTIVDRHQIIGVIVAPEVTVSRKYGWHLHQHLIVLVDGSRDDAQAAAEALTARYISEIRNRGGEISGKHGVWIETAADAAAAAEYAAKGSMSWEVAGGSTKADTKSGDSMTPWDLVISADRDGDAWARGRWSEYVATMPGTRSCVLTPSLAKTLGLATEDDKEDGEQQFHEADDIVGRLPSQTWRRLMSGCLAGTLLARVEAVGEAGFEEVAAWAEAAATEIDARMTAAREARDRHREEAKARIVDIDRRSAIRDAARRLAQGGQSIRSLDALHSAAANISATLPDARPVAPIEILSAMKAVSGDDLAR